MSDIELIKQRWEHNRDKLVNLWMEDAPAEKIEEVINIMNRLQHWIIELRIAKMKRNYKGMTEAMNLASINVKAASVAFSGMDFGFACAPPPPMHNCGHTSGLTSRRIFIDEIEYIQKPIEGESSTPKQFGLKKLGNHGRKFEN